MPDLAAFKRWVTSDWRAHSKWRSEAHENFRFIAGDQWTDEEKTILEATNRAPIVFNRSATIINAVAGSEINNRTEVRYIPRTLGDAEINEILTKGAQWFRDQSGAEEEESQAFRDMLVCGLGWTETLLDFEEDSEGEPRMERINPLEMVWDGSSERRGLVDARRVSRVRKMPLAEAQDLFPDASVTTLDAAWMDKLRSVEDEEEPHHQHSDDDYAHEDDDDITGDRDKEVTIVQLQWRQRVREVEYADPISGERKRMGKRRFGKMVDRIKKLGFEPQIATRDVARWEWKQAFIGSEVLEENQPCRDECTFVSMTGYWDNAKRRWFGLLQQMKDPQKWANKWMTQVQHIIATNSKGGVFVEHGATDDVRKFEEDYSAADSVVWLNQGALSQNKVQPKPEVPFPAPLMNLTEFAITSIRDVSGVNQELLGLRDQNQPGVLEYQRKQAAMTTLAVLFDALRHYRKRQGEVLLFYMREYLADGRLVRIADEQGERYEPLVIDPEVRKYDVIVDDAPSSPNQKERVWETIVQLMPLLQQAGLPGEIWAEIIEYAPFPPALVEKLQEYGRKAQQPDPQQQQMLQIALQKAMAEIESEKAGAQKDRAAALGEVAQAQKDAAEAQNAPLDAAVQIMDAITKRHQAARPATRPAS